MQDSELLPQREVLGDEARAGTESGEERRRDRGEHQSRPHPCAGGQARHVLPETRESSESNPCALERFQPARVHEKGRE